VRAGEVFVEGIEKTGVRDFGFCAPGDSPVWLGRKRLENGSRRECSLVDRSRAVWLIVNEIRKSKMEIPVKEKR
jgi:hypothetical protein